MSATLYSPKIEQIDVSLDPDLWHCMRREDETLSLCGKRCLDPHAMPGAEIPEENRCQECSHLLSLLDEGVL